MSIAKPMNENLTSIFLHQGEICIKSQPVVITTVLGSCISLTMFSSIHLTGAICHAVMPKCCGRERGRYVDTAFEEMLDAFASRGIKKESLKVKLFGGARMFMDCSRGIKHTIGDLNVKKALELIAKYRLDLVATDVGGSEGRKLFFYPHNGSVWVKKISKREMI